MQRYLGDAVIKRMLIPMWLQAEKIIDERNNKIASIIWQDVRAAGDPSPTWELSDVARDAGAQAMLYSSRRHPELSHIVVFETGCLRYLGPITEFIPETP